MRKRKQLTPEQEAAREERKAKLRACIQKIASMSDAERDELAMKAGVIVNCEGHALSVKNTMLLMLQHPGCSVVGGFVQWIKAGRVVRKGEHGSTIFFPKKGKKDEADTAAEAEGLTKEHDRQRFLLGTVFDISQTEELAPEEESEIETQAAYQLGSVSLEREAA